MRAKRLKPVLALATAAVASGCSGDLQGPCTPDRRIGLAIVIVNEQTGAHLCDAVVTARAGAYSETLLRTSDARVSACLYVGAVERFGTYSVRAEAAGFRPGLLLNVTVPLSEDGCHVERVQGEIRLLPTG